MLIGYARVSTQDQNAAMQVEALERAGCDRIFTDRASGGDPNRPGLCEALAALREGDVLVVWKLDRLGRSLSHLIDVTTDLGGRGVGFRSLTEAIDTTSAGGRLFFHMVGAFAEFERSMIRERTREGMAQARRNGTVMGRRPSLTRTQVEAARKLRDARTPMGEIARTLGVHRATVYRALSAAGAQP